MGASLSIKARRCPPKLEPPYQPVLSHKFQIPIDGGQANPRQSSPHQSEDLVRGGVRTDLGEFLENYPPLAGGTQRAAAMVAVRHSTLMLTIIIIESSRRRIFLNVPVAERSVANG